MKQKTASGAVGEINITLGRPKTEKGHESLEGVREEVKGLSYKVCYS